jgi:hypothetical protein
MILTDLNAADAPALPRATSRAMTAFSPKSTRVSRNVERTTTNW